MMMSFDDSERGTPFNSRGGVSYAGEGGSVGDTTVHEVNETTEMATPSDLSCQCGNIATAFSIDDVKSVSL
jgi:hypothetical protein